MRVDFDYNQAIKHHRVIYVFDSVTNISEHDGEKLYTPVSLEVGEVMNVTA
jgi:hypothetical protein